MSKRPPLKFIHTADWHLTNTFPYGGRSEQDGRLSRRLVDICWNIQKMIEFAKKKEADFILVAGDIFHARPDEITRRAFANLLREILFSNIHTIFTIGQHDIGREGHFLETFRAVVEEYPLDCGKVDVVSQLGNLQFVTSHSRSGINLVVQPWAREIDPREWRAWLDPASINILLGHFPVLGSWASSTYEAEKGVELSAKDVEPFSYIALGDFHHGNQLYYSGSPARVTFAERDQKKGFKYVVLHPGTGEVKRVFFADVHDRPFLQVDIAAGDGMDGVELPDPKGALVKLVVHGASQFVHEFAATGILRIIRKLRSEGVWDVFVSYDIVRREREARMAGVQVGVSLEEAIEVYTDKEPCAVEDQEALAELGQTILKEAREHAGT